MNPLQPDDRKPSFLATALVYPELPPAMRRRGPLAALRLFGPGAIMAAVTIGSGETLFASRSGAIFGYDLLWFIVLVIVCKLVQVYTGARYMVLTGEHPMEAWARLPGPRAWFPILLGGISILCFPFWMGGLAKMLGTAANWIFGLAAADPRQQVFASIFGTCTLALAAGLTLWQTYGILEKAQTAVVGVLLASILAAVVVAPVDWPEALRGLVGGGSLAYPDWMAAKYPAIRAEPIVLTLVIFMGAIGGGTQDYIGYLGFFREKPWGALAADDTGAADGMSAADGPGAADACPPLARGGHGGGTDGVKPSLLSYAASPRSRPSGPPCIDLSPSNLATGRLWLRAPMIDVFTGFLCVLLFTLAFNLLGASILHPKHSVPEKFELLSLQAQFLAQFGTAFVVLYKLGIVTAFWGNIYGALEVYTRTAYDCLRPLSSRLRDVPIARFRVAVCLYAGLGGILLIWLVAEPVSIVKPAALLASLGCGLWCFAMIWADRKYLPTGLRMNGLWVTLNLLAGGLLTAFAGRAIWDYVAGLA